MITVVIPCREGENPYTTLRSLAKQTLQPAAVAIIYDEGHGANWARNRGFEMVQTEFVLFSDNDIEWDAYALENMHDALQSHPQASYAYGWYCVDGEQIGGPPFSAKRLQQNNYISTMSLIRSADFPGFDESLHRLQDWDLWLTMLAQGMTGTNLDRRLFATRRRNGITFGSGTDWAEARAIVARKHGL